MPTKCSLGFGLGLGLGLGLGYWWTCYKSATQPLLPAVWSTVWTLKDFTYLLTYLLILWSIVHYGCTSVIFVIVIVTLHFVHQAHRWSQWLTLSDVPALFCCAVLRLTKTVLTAEQVANFNKFINVSNFVTYHYWQGRLHLGEDAALFCVIRK